MKRTLLLLYTLIAALSASAQARFSSNTELVQLGQLEWKRPAKANYIVTNTGDKPLVLTNVEPDCDCSSVQWTQTPIAPGEKGDICVTFDASLLGKFQKSVAVMTNAEPHLVYLRFSGEVVAEIRDYTLTHPYLIGQIRIDKNSLDFPDICRGQTAQLKLGVANLSDGPYEPVLMHLPSYLKAECVPAVLQKGEKGEMTITLDSDRLSDLGLTQTSVYLSRFTGDKVGEENEITVSAILLPHFPQIDEGGLATAPQLKLSHSELDLRAALAKKTKAKQDITLTNSGQSELHISKLQVFHSAVGVQLKKSRLLPGESTRLRVTIDRRNIGKSRHPLRLLIITNDPRRPKMEIEIKAK